MKSTATVFQLSLDDLTSQSNRTMYEVLYVLTKEGIITNQQAADFVDTHTAVPFNQNTLAKTVGE